jgi:hypothetical protein
VRTGGLAGVHVTPASELASTALWISDPGSGGRDDTAANPVVASDNEGASRWKFTRRLEGNDTGDHFSPPSTVWANVRLLFAAEPAVKTPCSTPAKATEPLPPAPVHSCRLTCHCAPPSVVRRSQPLLPSSEELMTQKSFWVGHEPFKNRPSSAGTDELLGVTFVKCSKSRVVRSVEAFDPLGVTATRANNGDED